MPHTFTGVHSVHGSMNELTRASSQLTFGNNVMLCDNILKMIQSYPEKTVVLYPKKQDLYPNGHEECLDETRASSKLTFGDNGHEGGLAGACHSLCSAQASCVEEASSVGLDIGNVHQHHQLRLCSSSHSNLFWNTRLDGQPSILPGFTLQ